VGLVENRRQVSNCQRFSSLAVSLNSEDGGDTFLRNVGSNKIYTAPHPRRRHSPTSLHEFPGHTYNPLLQQSWLIKARSFVKAVLDQSDSTVFVFVFVFVPVPPKQILIKLYSKSRWHIVQVIHSLQSIPKLSVRFEVFTAVTMKNTVFWDALVCLRSVLQLLPTANVVPSSLILSIQLVFLRSVLQLLPTANVVPSSLTLSIQLVFLRSVLQLLVTANVPSSLILSI
jgi:hypothetical protein